jgi:hypothetical protein
VQNNNDSAINIMGINHILNAHRMAGKKVKLIPVTGRGGPQGCETSRFPHFV